MASLRKSSAKTKAATSGKTGKLPEWNLADLYPSIDAPEVTRDLDKLDADCVAFEIAYKSKIAAAVAKPDGGTWLASAIKSYEAIDDLAGRLGSFAGLAHAGNQPLSVEALTMPCKISAFTSG